MKMSKRKGHVHPSQDSASQVGLLYKNQPVACLVLELLPKPLGCSSLLEFLFHFTSLGSSFFINNKRRLDQVHLSLNTKPLGFPCTGRRYIKREDESKNAQDGSIRRCISALTSEFY